jgi:outer membrane protein
MPRSPFSSFLLAAGILLFGTSAYAVKVGTVDMNRVFTEYYKTKEAQSQLNTERETSKRHLEERLTKLKDTMKVIESLSQDIKKPELSRLTKEAKTKKREMKVKEARELDRECSSFRAMKEQQLQEKFGHMRADIVQDIMKVVVAKVKSDSYDFVFDKSGLGFGGIPVVLHAPDDVDLTVQVISDLNKGMPKTKKPKKT